MVPTVSSWGSQWRPFALIVSPVRRAMLYVLGLSAFSAGGSSYAETFSATGMGGGVPDCAVGVFVVQLPPGLVDLCDLELDITGMTHVIPSDFDIYLIDPFGTGIEIMTDRGGAVPVSGITVTFSDRGSRLPSESGPLVSDTFLPEGLANGADQGFATFDGTAGGDDPWILAVIDDTCGSTGSFASFTLRGSYGPGACVPEVGACCDGNTGRCADELPQSDCPLDDSQFTWFKNTRCDQIVPPCAQHRGACCDRLSGLCTDDMLPNDCRNVSPGDQLLWFKSARCQDVDCVEELGACCDRNAGPLADNGVCVDGVPSRQCQCPRCLWFKTIPCEVVLQERLCDPDFVAVPTVSEWGLVITTLLLWCGAKIYFGRRTAISAPSKK